MIISNGFKVSNFKVCLFSRSSIAIFPARAFSASVFENLSFLNKARIFAVGCISVVLSIWRLEFFGARTPTLLVSSLWSNGYHHFVCEMLPKLIVYRSELNDLTLLVPKNSPRFVAEAIKFYFPRLNTHFFDGPVFSRNLLIIHNKHSGYFDPELLAHMRAFFFGSYSSGLQANKRVYLTRKSSRSRHVINEAQLVSVLARYGFTVFSCDELSLQEQVSLFSEVSVLLGVHGAGLTNMIHMPNSSVVLELVPDPNSIDIYRINRCYQRLAMALKIRYASFPVTKVHFDLQYDESDVWVNVSSLELVLRKIFEQLEAKAELY